jgi:hypothetical protein
MVHTLSEINRVLVPDGILIDLRPLLDRWKIEVASAREICDTGRMKDFEIGLKDDEAANRSMSIVEKNGWFTRESEEFFPYIYSWDSANEMEKWIQDEWEGFIDLEDDTKRATRSVWASADGDARVQVNMKMLITRWKKVTTHDNDHHA